MRFQGLLKGLMEDTGIFHEHFFIIIRWVLLEDMANMGISKGICP